MSWCLSEKCDGANNNVHTGDSGADWGGWAWGAQGVCPDRRLRHSPKSSFARLNDIVETAASEYEAAICFLH